MSFNARTFANVLIVDATSTDGALHVESNRRGSSEIVQTDTPGIRFSRTIVDQATTCRGTSVAADIMTATAATVLAKNRSLFAVQLRQFLVSTVSPAGSKNQGIREIG